MWQNIKIYVLAYAVMMAGALVSTGFQLVGDQFPVGHPISIMAANLSGMTVGGMIMVLGFIRDGRIEEERKRTAAAEARAQEAEGKAESAQAKVAAAEAKTEAAQATLERERERADAAEARAERLMDRYEAATELLMRRLEELNGGKPEE